MRKVRACSNASIFLRHNCPEQDNHSIGVDFQIEDLAVGVNLNLLREVAEGNGFDDLSDRADLGCYVHRKVLHDTRELTPCCFDDQDKCLSVKFSVRMSVGWLH